VRFSFRGLVAAFCLVLVGWLAGCAGYSTQQATATAQGGTLSVSASSLNFQTVVVGQTGQQSLQLTNNEKSSVKVNAVSLSSSQFTMAGPSAPFTVKPSQSVSYTVTFAPTTAGAQSATLNIASKAPVSPQVVSLSGTGEKAVATLVVSPPTVNFGNQTVKTMKSQTVSLQNTGDVGLTIQGVTGGGGAFSYSDLSPGTTIGAGQQITFQVSFDPTATGAASATLSFTSSGLSSPGTLSLNGDGVNASAPPPSTPQAHKVHLTWDASKSQVIGYIVYRSEASGGPFTPLFGTPINDLSYDDSSVSDGSTYYYVVTSVDAAGEQSVHSNEVTAAIP
jgi:hypothetical protein